MEERPWASGPAAWERVWGQPALPACAPPTCGGWGSSGQALVPNRKTLFDLQSYTGFFSFLLQVFSFGEGNVALRGSQ